MFITILLLLGTFIISIRVANKIRRLRHKKFVLGFFHPYCNDGGGGERVLWRCIWTIQQIDTHQNVHIVIYSGDVDVKPEEILEKAKVRFGITITPTVEFVFLKQRHLVETKMWPRLTMIGQSLGSMILGLEALYKCCPDVFLDTMGYAFTFPIFSILGGSVIGAYVHYPTISNDMVEKVVSGEESFNNNNNISKSSSKTLLKIWYYKFFALLYRFMGSFCSLVMVNSTWTKNHIKARWNPKEMHLIYPPIDCQNLREISSKNRKKIILSIGQFRPEKNHELQIRAFAEFLKYSADPEVMLVMVGSVRQHVVEDLARVAALQRLVEELGIKDRVVIAKNITNQELKEWLSLATIGIHTMNQEHFGIGIVEFMAAGVIPIAHNSGGPKEDIIVNHNHKKIGFLASTAAEYASHIAEIFSHPEEAANIQRNARIAAEKFSDETFSNLFLDALVKLKPFRYVLPGHKCS